MFAAEKNRWRIYIRRDWGGCWK